MKKEALRRIARRALIGVESMPVEERIQLLQDVAHLLPKEEAQSARDAAFHLKHSMELQNDFLSLLK